MGVPTVRVAADECPPGVVGTCYTNPIGANDFPTLIQNLANAVAEVGLPLAAAAIIWVGLKFITGAASGNPAKVAEARKMLWPVLIGTAILTAAWVIATVVINFAKSLGG